MIDNFTIRQLFLRLPNEDFLGQMGWKQFLKPNGKISRFVLVEGRKKNEPRLTIYPTYDKAYWYINASVTLTSWFEGSNIRLVTEPELKEGLITLSDYVKEKSGVNFEAMNGIVTKVEFTQDFKVPEKRILSIVTALNKQGINRYLTKPYQTATNFENVGKQKNQLIKVYSKYHQFKAKAKDSDLLEQAKGILRFEVQLRKRAIYYLAKSLKLPDHSAKHILTKKTSEKVIEKKMNLIHLDKYLNNEVFDVLNLYKVYSKPYATKLIAFLALENKYGKNLYDFEEYPYSKSTIQKHKRDCNKAGVLSFE